MTRRQGRKKLGAIEYPKLQILVILSKMPQNTFFSRITLCTLLWKQMKNTVFQAKILVFILKNTFFFHKRLASLMYMYISTSFVQLSFYQFCLSSRGKSIRHVKYGQTKRAPPTADAAAEGYRVPWIDDDSDDDDSNENGNQRFCEWKIALHYFDYFKKWLKPQYNFGFNNLNKKILQ